MDEGRTEPHTQDIVPWRHVHLLEDVLSPRVFHPLGMRHREQLNEARVLGESGDALLLQRDVLGVDGRLSRELVAEVEVDPQMEMATHVVILQHPAMPRDELRGRRTPWWQLYNQTRPLRRPMSSMESWMLTKTEGSV